MLHNVEYISQYIPDEACEVCRDWQCSIENDCSVALVRGNVISVLLCINSLSHGQWK